jgi:hypothetical protein
VAGTLETLALVSITIQLQRGKERGLTRGEGDGVAAIVSRSLAGISSGPDTRSLASASRALPRLKTALEPIERYYLFRRARERERETMYARVAIVARRGDETRTVETPPLPVFTSAVFAGASGAALF